MRIECHWSQYTIPKVIIFGIALLIIVFSCIQFTKTQIDHHACEIQHPVYPGKYQPLDGEHNHLYNYGVAESTFPRYVEQEDFIGDELDEENLPEPRKVSNMMCKQGKSKPNKMGLSVMHAYFGQLIDHFVTLTKTNSRDKIYLDFSNDYEFNTLGKTIKLPLSRSVFKSDVRGNRQQVNSLTPFIDASIVYSTDKQRLRKMRRHKKGLMRLPRGLPPKNTHRFENACHGPPSRCFLVGDIRGSENSVLTSLHVLFIKNHNYWARHFYKRHKNWSDNRLFYYARKMNIGELQKITTDWVEAALGEHIHIGCYDESVDPRIRNEFSTAAFRFGHSVIPDNVLSLNIKHGNVKRDYSLKDLVFTPEHLYNRSVKPAELLYGVTQQLCEENDLHIVDSLRSSTFTGHLFDLVSFNMKRGIDHNIAYYKLRLKMGGSRVKCWADITKDNHVALRLKQLYGEYGWQSMHAIIGLLAEDHIPGSLFGYTMHHVIKDQFTRLIRGDRYFYLWDSFYDEVRENMKHITLRDLLLRNTKINPYLLQKDVFFV
jgi:peroxidase